MKLRRISKTRIERRMRKKANPCLVETIVKLKKINPELAKILVMPRKKQFKINLESLEKLCNDNDKILVPGKILSSGNFTKKVKIMALSASEKAVEKIKKSKSELSFIHQELDKKINEYKLIR